MKTWLLDPLGLRNVQLRVSRRKSAMPCKPVALAQRTGWPETLRALINAQDAHLQFHYPVAGGCPVTVNDWTKLCKGLYAGSHTHTQATCGTPVDVRPTEQYHKYSPLHIHQNQPKLHKWSKIARKIIQNRTLYRLHRSPTGSLTRGPTTGTTKGPRITRPPTQHTAGGSTQEEALQEAFPGPEAAKEAPRNPHTTGNPTAGPTIGSRKRLRKGMQPYTESATRSRARGPTTRVSRRTGRAGGLTRSPTTIFTGGTSSTSKRRPQESSTARGGLWEGYRSTAEEASHEARSRPSRPYRRHRKGSHEGFMGGPKGSPKNRFSFETAMLAPTKHLR